MSVHIHRNSFNAGEISSRMDARVDEAKYGFSCRILENFIPGIYGGAFRRPGTIYTGTARNVAEWTEIEVNHTPSLLYGGESDAASGSADTGALTDTRQAFMGLTVNGIDDGAGGSASASAFST